MDQKNLNIFRRYTFHVFLRHLSLTLFFSFGALLIYERTHSIFWVLMFGLIANMAGLFIRSFGIAILWKAFMRFGAQVFMAGGLVLLSLSLFGLFYLDPAFPFFVPALVLIAIAHDFGAGLYWIPSNALLWKTVGSLSLPGRYSAIISIVKTTAVVLGAILGLFFNVHAIFLLLFPLAGCILLASIIPLRGIPVVPETGLSLRRALNSISPAAFLGNMELHVPIRLTVLPLIVFLISSSLSTSIGVVGIAAIGQAVFAYLTGKYKDRNDPFLNTFAIIGLVLIWIIYAFVSVPAWFIVLGIIAGILDDIVSTGREARLSRDVANTGRAVEATIAIEIARQIGPALIFAFLLLVYSVTGTLPQSLLVLGGILLLPVGIYAIGGIQKLRIQSHKN